MPSLINEVNNYQWTCLYYAAERKEKSIIMLLLRRGAGNCYCLTFETIFIVCCVDPTACHKKQRNALHFAARYSSLECLEAILSPEIKEKLYAI